MRIELFGILAQIAEQNVIEMNAANDVLAVRELLVQKFPGFRNQKFRIAVNLQLVDDTYALNEQDKIVLLPPFAGG